MSDLRNLGRITHSGPPIRPGILRVVAVGLVLGLAVVACGKSYPPRATRTTDQTTPTTAASGTASTDTTVPRGGPRWETIVTLEGTGAAEPPAFPILGDSLQWRARWRCDTGRLRIVTDPPPRRPVPLVDGACPATGEGFAIVTGDVRLTIAATGPWEVIVDQQVDTPLREPPFEGMATAPVLAQGDLYPVEKDAKGTARLYRRADGANVLRLEGFEVSNNVDLFVWLSEAGAPRTSAEVVAAPHVVLGNLKSTVGTQNYVLPDLPLERVRSLVIWCEPVRIAYGAASFAMNP